MKKDISFLLLIVMITLAITPFMSADTQLFTPVSNSNLSGSVLFSCNTTMGNVVNMSIVQNLSGTFSYIGSNVSNTTAGQTSFNQTISTSAFTDSSAYTFYCVAYNVTALFENSTMNTGITVDNTAPVCSVSLAYPYIDYQGVQIITWSVTDSLGLVTNTQTITAPSSAGNLAYTVANSSSTTIKGTQTAYSGNWNASSYGVDRSGNTCSASKAFSSVVPNGNVQTTTGTSGTTPVNTRTLLIIGGIALLAYFLLKKK